MSFVEFGRKFAMFYLPFLFSLCVHEYAHGLVAKWKGDMTASLMGRLTLNPMAHVDWIGTVALPFFALLSPMGFFFGWAKPVPVNVRNLKNPTKDMFWIALAGPLSNVLLAFLGSLVFIGVVYFARRTQVYQSLEELFYMFIGLNLILAVFNMIPLHPLDGGKVFARFLPRVANDFLEQIEPYSMFIIFGIFLLGGGFFLFQPVYYATNVMMSVSHYLGYVLSS
ncbi:MAG: site-2 protease family protein [Bdellovibrionales bacterium]|nr:site-2 protease family protein [Bdellovibrionales bacterium]